MVDFLKSTKFGGKLHSELLKTLIQGYIACQRQDKACIMLEKYIMLKEKGSLKKAEKFGTMPQLAKVIFEFLTFYCPFILHNN